MSSAPQRLRDDRIGETAGGVGPLILDEPESLRPLRQQVFERIRAAGALPRVQVAKDLGVSPASVTGAVADLIAAGLVEEVAPARPEADTGRGRPPVALGVRPQAHRVAGIKLSDREHTGVIVDFAGNLLAREAEAVPPGLRETGELLGMAARLVDRLCVAAGIGRDALSAVGIGVPGFVERRGRVIWSPVLRDREVDLAAAAAAHLGLPVHVDNDANLVALAELWFGAGRGLADFAVVTIEHGVGMGLVLNHRLFRGSRGLATELGHTKVQLDGALCRCGQRGCLEAYVADYALAREAVTALDWTHHAAQPVPVLLETLFDHAKAGNAAARSIFRRAGRYLAAGLANVVNLFDPALIILSGDRMRYDYLYADEALAEMGRMVVAPGRPAPRIEVHAWGDLLWARGAAALALSEVTAGVLRTPRAGAAA
jgi:predicted NBD/HSP70 family sugar kinase